MFKNKAYYRILDALLDTIEHEKYPHHTLARMVDRIVKEFGETMRITDGRVYMRSDDVFLCRHSSGGSGSAFQGIEIPLSYPPVEAIIEGKVLIIADDFPGYDAQIENQFHASRYAAFSVDSGHYLIAFGMALDADDETLRFALGTIQHSLNLKLRQASMEAEISEAEAIQLSLLPAFPPRFDGFDIAARTYPAEATEVGGDIHDFIDLGRESLGIAVADASGHGLPAALQARDIVTGLRMGVEKEMKITAVIARLNKVIHASRLSSRFVSLFYAELERNGNLIYVNAGHCQPIMVQEMGPPLRLETGGAILGPTSDASYQRGFIHLLPGTQLLIYTDGIFERAAGEDQFGEPRLIRLFQSCFSLSSQETVDRIVEEVRAFGEGAPWEDDVTLLVIKPT